MSWLLSKLSAAKFAMRVARACMKTRSFLRSKIICPFKGPRAELNSSDSLSRLRGTYSTISVRSSFDRGGRAALIGVHIYLNVNCMPDGIVVRKIGLRYNLDLLGLLPLPLIGSCMKVQSNTLSWRPGNAVCAPGLHTALVTRKLVKSSYRLKTERSALGAWSDPLLGSSPDGVLDWSCLSSWTCVNSWFLRSATSGNQCNIRCLIIMHLLSSCVPDIGNRKSESYH